MDNNILIPDSKTPLGANYDEENNCVNFKIYSKNAEMVILCIFEQAQGQDAVMNLAMEKIPNTDIWQTSVKTYALKELKEPFFYGYRLFGPNWHYSEDFEIGTDKGFVCHVDDFGNRFNPNKLAYDPYSKELSHLPSDVCPSLEIFRSGDANYLSDNAKLAPKSVFFADLNPEPIVKLAPRPFSEEIIAETHLKDLTICFKDGGHGTYLSAAKFSKKIKEAGFTMVEFLPLNEFDYREDGTNYWGYMPLCYFALAKHYANDKSYGGTLKEFRRMVNEFHKNGLKVCMDVVYNHTGEARIHYENNDDATLLSYALIDNSSYYKMTCNPSGSECGNPEGKTKYYRSISGCHNDTNTTNEGFYNLVADSVAYWAKQGVDAFRFDLAVSLTDVSDNQNPNYKPKDSLAAKLVEELDKRGIKTACAETGQNEGITLIAEPWTCWGDNCYQLGKFPCGWMEWNDISRDTIRRAALYPEQLNFGDIKNVIEGTKTRFGEKYGAINYVSCHDGFSLYDLNSFNEPAPDTTGGSKWEICYANCNEEYRKENAIKKELTLLFLSKGVPMMQMGDIILHSKGGNNNSYNRDDSTNYYNWELAKIPNTLENKIFEFTKNLIRFRSEHKIFSKIDYDKNITYFDENSNLIETSNKAFWEDYSKGYLGINIKDENTNLFAACSKVQYNIQTLLPAPDSGKNWYIIFDTSNTEHSNLEPKPFFGREYVLNPNSIVVFKAL